jgi:hypothetical protein
MIDSLGKKYHKNVIGFSRSVTINPSCQETFMIFYTVNGEMYDEIVWSKELLDNNQTNQIIILSSPFKYELYESNIDTTLIVIKNFQSKPSASSVPFYVYNYYGSGALIGFINNRIFIKIKINEYKIYAVPTWAQKILENNTELNKILKERYGNYILEVF